MARTVHARWIIEGDLRALTPVHVGGETEGNVVDLVPAVDGRGRFYVPGTSLAGALREWMTRRVLGGEPAVDGLWGFQRSDAGHASFVTVEDAVVALPKGASVEVRDGVGIDRVTGAAAPSVKYDRAVLPRDSRLAIRILVDAALADDAAHVESQVAELVRALSQGLIRLGAGKTRGLGRVVLENAKVLRQDLGSRAGMLSVLRGSPEELRIDELAALPMNPVPMLEVTVDWRSVGPLMVGSGRANLGVDHLPLVGHTDDGVALVVPGSSVKGVLRANAERIVRTVMASGAQKAEKGDEFRAQIDVPLVSELFGATGEGAEDAEWMPGLGAVGIDDAYAHHRADAGDWAKIEAAATDADVLEGLRTAGLEKSTVAYHVAVDRWTGSAADRQLFTTVEPFAIEYEPLRISIDLDRLSEDSAPAGLGLLLLALRDLARGSLPLGFGGNRGLGEIAVDAIRFEGQDLPVDMQELATFAWAAPWDLSFAGEIGRAWIEYVEGGDQS
ncbi:MAG: hypothetical protein FD171_863 [Actinobacteria bacterium]|nr:MAG: hypothetical protein FD171_863 [Actinomycetota bacterium]